MTVVSWPEEIVREVAAQRVVIFFGSGVSANSLSAAGDKRPPGWWTFLSDGASRLPPGPRRSVVSLLKGGNLLLACDVIRESLGQEEFKRFLRERFHDPGYRPAEVHRWLLRLDSRVTITPNFDVIYDTFVAAETNNTVLIKNYYDEDAAESLRSRYPVVFKLHGSITSPDRLIFTATDYAQARSKADTFYSLVRALLCTHTFLFVGCGLDDPDIRMLLEDYKYRHAIGARHFFLIAKGAVDSRVLPIVGRSMGLQFIEYKNPERDHRNFTVAIQELVEAVNIDRLVG